MRILRFRWTIVFLAALLGGAAAPSARETSDDKTLSPYFFVRSDDPADQLPLKSTSADVRIAGVIADVRVAQVYRNEGTRPIEAVYVFPASTRAAVHGMKMTIGERVIEAKIDRREAARREYETAREQGRSASLLEQARPNVFQMQVANIMPGARVTVDLRYTEVLVPTDRVYEFVYPTVVGPRYSNQAAATAPASERWVANPYLRAGEPAASALDITVALHAGLPIKELASTSHKVVATYQGPSAATVKLDPSEGSGGNRDYILRYRLGGDRIESGLLLHEGNGENFFLLTLEPPKRVTQAAIPGREYVFIVDVSGSMHGFPLEVSKKLLRELLGHLRPTDRFNVLLFSGGSSLLSPASVPASPENLQRALRVIERETGGGGTELLPALQRALALPRPEGYSRTVVIATDGYVHVEEQAFDLIRHNLGRANFFAFGIGTAVNRHLIEGMARVGMGEPFVITRPDEAAARADRFRVMVQSPLLTGIRVDFQGFDAYDVEPVSIPDVLAERPVTVFGKWRGPARGSITVRGTGGAGPYAETARVSADGSRENPALRYLWARQRIAILSDYNMLRQEDKRVAEVTDLGLKYSLLTAYTSFVAADTQVVNSGGRQTTVTQPLPLPQGVSEYAVGGQVRTKAAAPLFMSPISPSAMPGVHGSRDAWSHEERPGRAVRVARVNGTQGVSRTDVLEAVKTQVASLERCGTGSGQLVLELRIGEDGTLEAVTILSSTLQDTRAAKCVVEQVRQARFPASAGKARATITLTLS
ncbi:MAG: VIT domain-containing protein [Candidatus Methylomirabilales bacterium]